MSIRSETKPTMLLIGVGTRKAIIGHKLQDVTNLSPCIANLIPLAVRCPSTRCGARLQIGACSSPLHLLRCLNACKVRVAPTVLPSSASCEALQGQIPTQGKRRHHRLQLDVSFKTAQRSRPLTQSSKEKSETREHQAVKALFIKSSFIATALVLLMQLAWLKVRPKQTPFFLEFGDVIGEGSGEGSPSSAKDVQDPLLSILSPPTHRVGDDCTKGLTILLALDFPNFPDSHLCSANMHVAQSLPAAIEPK